MTTVKLIPQPKRLTTPLFIHQKANIWKMELLERTKKATLANGDVLESNIGILADPPGTGKTKTVIGLICRDMMVWKGPLHSTTRQLCSNIDGNIRITRSETFTRLNTNLIVTPLSIFRQWESELKETDLSYKLIDRKSDCVDIEKYEVVVCTINMYNHLSFRYRDCVFKRFIYDEMDSAYIPNMERIEAGHLWFVSATFSTVLAEIRRSRTIHFMKKLFMNIISDEYNPGAVLDCITVKSSEKLRNLRPVPSEYKTVHYNIGQPKVVSIFNQYMDTELVEMIGAGNIRDAVKHLGGKEDESTILDLLRSRADKKVWEAEMKVQEYKGKQKEEWAENLNKYKNSRDDIETKYRSLSDQDCPICSDKMNGAILLECCQQLICCGCLKGWMEKEQSCPFCRVKTPKMTKLSTQTDDGKVREQKTIVSSRSKYDIVKGIVSGKGTKILIYASYDNLFTEIGEILKEGGMEYAMLAGTASKRQTILDGYIKGNTKILVLNSRLNGAGLNLQVTTDIILWHQMSDSLNGQMIGRALRYGLNHQLTVHKLYSG